MSDDLISRKVLLDELNGLRIELNGISCRKEFKKTVKEVLDCVKHIVEDQPTAFDKEKVIKELREELNLSDAEKERCARENPLQFDSAKGYANGIANSIEIVEKGGIE